MTWKVWSCVELESTFGLTAELFIDLFSNYSRFLTAKDYRILSLSFQDSWAQSGLARLQAGDFSFDSLQFGNLLLAFGDATLQDLASDSEHDDSRHIMSMLHRLLTCDGIAIVEDEICLLALEFWSAFVEFVVTELFGDSEHNFPWLNAARNHTTQAIQESWLKIRIPDFQMIATWDTDIRRGFGEFRKDVADLLQSSYSLLGSRLFETFADVAWNSLRSAAWEDFEAALFCLNAISDCMSEGQEDERQIERLLKSSEFTSCLDLTMGIPLKTIQSLVDFLGHYATFFEKHTQYLPSPLRFLFQCLGVPSITGEASKSIASLCSSCRQVLAPEIDAFIKQYEIFLNGGPVDVSTKNRVLGAIASIVQALGSEEAKARHLTDLFVFVRRDVHACLNHAAAHQPVEAEEAGAAALQSLTSIGKGLQAPDDVPIDLDSDTPPSRYWLQGAGASSQSQIVETIDQVVEAVPQSGAIIEAACSVYRAGFTETSPGPFVFPAARTTQFLLRSRIDTPRLSLVLSTACALISSHSTDSSARVDTEAQALLAHAINLIHQLGGKCSLMVSWW